MAALGSATLQTHCLRAALPATRAEVSPHPCMKTPALPSLPLSIVALCLALLLPSYPRAADAVAPTGAVQGRVQDAVTGQYLAKARVIVKGSARAYLTDETGQFQIPDVPAGVAVLEVFHTGLDPAQVTVQVGAGARTARITARRVPAGRLSALRLRGIGRGARRVIVTVTPSVPGAQAVTLTRSLRRSA